MSINWHDLIRFHHSPSEDHKKPNVWAGNGMGSLLWTGNHMDYFIQNKRHLSANCSVVERMGKMWRHKCTAWLCSFSFTSALA